jgi:hypothetical protein
VRLPALILFALGLLMPVVARADWSTFYRGLEADPRVPAFGHTERGELEWVVQDDVVNLGEVTDTAAYRRARPLVTYVFADVVHVPAGYIQVLDEQLLVIVARRVEVARDAVFYLDYSEGRSAALALYTAEWSGHIDAIGFEDPYAEQVEVHALGGGALETLVAHDGAHTVAYEGDHVPSELYAERDELGRSLERALIAASALRTDELEPRLALLDWVLRVASRAPAHGRFAELAADSGAQLGFWQASAHGNHVPELDREVYLDVAETYLTALERYQTQYDRFLDRAAGSRERAAAARLMLAQSEAAIEEKEAYLEQARRVAHGAGATVAQAELNFERQEEALALARIRFEAGIELWKHDMTVKAVFGAVEALLNFAGAVASGMAGAKSADVANHIKSVADVARSTAAAMASLQRIVESVKALSKGSLKLAEAAEAGDMNALASAADELDGLAGTFLFADESWTEFALESRALLKFAIDQSVRGATDYQIELETMALRGQTLIEARRMQARAHQEVAQLLLSMRFEQAGRQRVEALVQSFERTREHEDALASTFLARMIALKRPVYLALLSYASAYRYWALRELALPVSLLDDAATFRTYLATIQRAYASALRDFPQPPQRFQHKTLEITDPAALAQLRESGQLVVSLPLDSPVFRGLGRVRLDGVRAYFVGARCPERRCFATLRTSGRHEDRLGGRAVTFSGPSLLRVFEYAQDGAQTVLIDGQLADQLAFAYFEPTPFTDWTVSLSDALNPGLDRSAVERVVLEWSGSAIAESTLSSSHESG